MKKTLTINISGNVFHIEEDAYDQLQDYLLCLSKYFSSQPAGQEILSDIESRIAELFREKITDKQESVKIEWVDEVMAKMGKPEDFIETGESQNAENDEFKGERIRKRMYRDTENRVLGGVCSGMSAYFNTDPVFLRILFILMVFLGAGISIIVYLVFWIVVPKATTTAQRLEMRGEAPTISNIQKTIQEEVKEVRNSFSKFNRSETYKKGKNAFNYAGKTAGQAFNSIGRLIAILLGALLILIGFISLFAFFISLIAGGSVFQSNVEGYPSTMDLSSFLELFISPGMVSVSILLIVLLIGIPLLALFFVGTKMVFRYKTNNKAIGLGAFGIWLLALLAGTMITVDQINNYSVENTATTGKQIDCQSCKTLYLELGQTPEHLETDGNMHINDFIVTNENGKQILAGQPHLNIESTDGTEFLVSVRKTARGRNREDIQQSLQNIEYEINSQDSTLVLSPFFVVNQSKWRSQEVQVTVKVPKGKKVHLGPNLDHLHFDFEDITNSWDTERIGQTFLMTDDGLAMNK
ncbi:MAG TPA: PspC domain-containing protein [Prolixibacteraceae bacterium]|nr:PspC domain-containing protein [Prolixibacteraceae bacterium]